MRTDLTLDVQPAARGSRGVAQGKILTRRDEAQEGQRLKAVAREFESLLMEQLVQQMRKATPKADLFGKDNGMDTYREMLDGEYVRLLEDRGGMGLADFMVKYMNDPRAGDAKPGPSSIHPASRNSQQVGTAHRPVLPGPGNAAGIPRMPQAIQQELRRTEVAPWVPTDLWLRQNVTPGLESAWPGPAADKP